MPPRSRSKNAQNADEHKDDEKRSPKNDSSVPSDLSRLPPPNPTEVKRLVDSAISRAHSAQGLTPRYKNNGGCNSCIITRIWHYFFGNFRVEYSRTMTAILTDIVGMFLVVLFAFYFTAAGYLWYRETALKN